MILTGERQALDPVFRAIHDFVDELVVASDAERVREISHIITLMALGDALLGVPLADPLGLDPKAARQLALQQRVALYGLEDQGPIAVRSAEHTSELQSLLRNSYADTSLKKTNYKQATKTHH